MNTIQDFIEEIRITGKITNEDIIFTEQEIVISAIEHNEIVFENCKISAKTLTFKKINNPNTRIIFENCSIKAPLLFVECTLETIIIEFIKDLSGLFMYDCNLKHIGIGRKWIKDINEHTIKSHIQIKKCIVGHFSLRFSNQAEGAIILDGNTFGAETNSNCFEMIGANVSNMLLINNRFLNHSSFEEIQFTSDFQKYIFPQTPHYFNSYHYKQYYHTYWRNNRFEKITIENCSINDTLYSDNDEFNSLAKFKFKSGDIGFFEATFHNKVIIESSVLSHFTLKQVDFKDLVSFQNTIVETIKITEPVFSSYVYFDDLQISMLEKCDRKTIRTIKQQLQKTDNKIDYNRFRSYELSAYYRELNWKWKEGFKDKFILAATWLVTGFEHSWRRALGFTLISAVVSYTLFYISENYYLAPDLDEWQPFASSYFRFLIVTDFYNPLADGRTYIDNTNTIGWLIFILGKIFIAFGIYEMIQAFRKFKA